MKNNIQKLFRTGPRLLGPQGKPVAAPRHVLVAVLSKSDHVELDYTMSLAAMMLMSKAGGILRVSGSLVHNARNLAVAGAKANHGTHLMFIDTDMVFPPETIQRLLAHDEDIVGCTYPRRTPPHELMFKLLPGQERIEQSDGLVEVAALPTGCMLIAMRVFEKLEEPYFRLPSWARGETVPEPLRYYCQNSIDGPGVSQVPHGLGEDNYFCAMARAAGFKIWCDVGLSPKIGHVGQHVVFPATEERPA